MVGISEVSILVSDLFSVIINDLNMGVQCTPNKFAEFNEIP